MSPPEITYKRPTNYSHWHRPEAGHLPGWCLLSDADWFEVRENHAGQLIVVACVETIEVPPVFIDIAHEQYKLWEIKGAALRQITERMKIPVLIVRHTADCKLFNVALLKLDGTEIGHQIMSEPEYVNLILSLGKVSIATNLK